MADNSSTLLTAQLLFLEAEDATKPIKLYINSPGGSVTAGLGIYDTVSINFVSYSRLKLMALFVMTDAGKSGSRSERHNPDAWLNSVHCLVRLPTDSHLLHRSSSIDGFAPSLCRGQRPSIYPAELKRDDSSYALIIHRLQQRLHPRPTDHFLSE